MIEIILNTPATAECGETHMTRPVLEHLLEQAAQEGLREVSLYVQTDPCDWLPDVIGGGRWPILFKICLDADVSPMSLGLALRKNSRLCLTANINRDTGQLQEKCSQFMALGLPVQQAEVFLPWPQLDCPVAEACRQAHLPPDLVVTLGVGWQSMTSGPVPLSTSEWSQWVPRLMAVFAQLSMKRATVNLACGVPLCLFTTRELGLISSWRMRFPIASCPLELIFDTEAQGHLCRRLKSATNDVCLGDTSMRSLQARLLERYQVLGGLCEHVNEEDCRPRRTGACGGGCLAHSISAWRQTPLPTALER